MQIPERETVLHSWCVQSQWHGPTIVGGSGARFWDDQGRTYLDMSSLAECVNLGHQHPKVVAAIREQAERLCYVTAAWGAEPRARLAQRILELSGFAGGRVYFTLGGADANEHAVKFARQASGLPHGTIITRSRSYHGASYAAGALSGDYRTESQMDPAAFNVVHCQPPYAYRCPYGTHSDEACGRMGAEEVDRLIRQDARGVAAVLMETDAGTNGVVAPDNYWPLLREATRRAGVLLAADEVMSGFGRCGEWFAWQRYGEAGRPDLMTLAKGLTGGHLPLAAVVLSREVAARLEDQMLYTGLTYCGHPLCCAAGVAALAAYEEEGLIQHSRTLGGYLLQQLQAMAERHPVIGDVRGGHGLFAVGELVKDRETREPLAPWGTESPRLRALVDQARVRGVSFAARGNLLFLAPPLVVTGKELDLALQLLDSLLTDLEAPCGS
jgi:taurine--2-oxoglutarate transaminase